jgi:hypothetical protein
MNPIFERHYLSSAYISGKSSTEDVDFAASMNTIYRHQAQNPGIEGQYAEK